MIWPVAVIGGGASGLFCACKLAKSGVSVLLLEGEPRVGKKLLATGNGRCNLTNRDISAPFYHGNFSLSDSFWTRFSCQRICDEFKNLGLLTREESEGRIYPYSLQASTVLDILRFHCESFSVETKCEQPVISVKREKKFFVIETQNHEFYQAEKVILACGSPAGSHLGCAKGGYALAKQLGHRVFEPSAALVPVKVPKDSVRALKGLRCKAKVSLLKGEKVVKQETGEVQFADGALSGICVFNLSHMAKKGMKITLDLMPEYEEEEIAELLQKNPEQALLGILNKRIAQEILKRTDKSSPKEIAALIKSFDFDVMGVESMDRAQVASGGVPLNEICPETMESQKQAGAYIIGELLDVHGDCGGFNLHFAWSSAIAAAEHILSGKKVQV